MSIGPLPPLFSSIAGAPLSQTSGSEVERSKKEAQAHSRIADAEAKAVDAAGIGKTSGEEKASDRDADGRRLWETHNHDKNPETSSETLPLAPPKPVKDPRGESGSQLDLTG